MSKTSKAAALVAHFRSPFWLFALISLVVPAAAWGDIYKWTDEQGRTVLSNVPPTKSGKVKNVELLVKEARAATKAPVSIPEHMATPTEQAFLAGIESLERQLQARQHAAQAAHSPTIAVSRPSKNLRSDLAPAALHVSGFDKAQSGRGTPPFLGSDV